MATYNDAIDDAAKVALPPAYEKPCDCIEKDERSGFWMERCYCQNSGDLSGASSWCTAANTADAIRKLRR